MRHTAPICRLSASALESSPTSKRDAALNVNGVRTPDGVRWHTRSVALVLASKLDRRTDRTRAEVQPSIRRDRLSAAPAYGWEVALVATPECPGSRSRAILRVNSLAPGFGTFASGRQVRLSALCNLQERINTGVPMWTRTRGTSADRELVTSRVAGAEAVSPHHRQPQPVDVVTDDGTITACIQGGSGETVVLLHGGPGCPDYLQPVAQLLPAHLRVVTFDQRGVGGSAPARTFTLEDYLSDIEAVRRHLDVERIHLLGHSWGGLLAQVYASTFPERVASLVLTNSAAGVGKHWRQVEREVMAYNRKRSGPGGFVAMGLWAALMVLPGRVGDVAGRRLLKRVWRNYFPDNASAPSADPAWLAGSSRTAAVKTTAAIKIADTNMLDGLHSRLGAPVLLVYGDHDIYGASKDLLETRFAPAHDVTTLKHCGHLPWLQAPGAFAALLRDFYATAAPATDENSRRPRAARPAAEDPLRTKASGTDSFGGEAVAAGDVGAAATPTRQVSPR